MKSKPRQKKRIEGPVRADTGVFTSASWHLNRLYCRMLHGFAWKAPDPLPVEGPVILVCNHRSSVDPSILCASTRRMLSFLIAREFYYVPLLSRLFEWMGCIPVKRDSQDIGALRQALRALQRGRVLCIFPEGGIDRDADDARHGTAYLAWRSKAPVIPAGIIGTPRNPSVWRTLFIPSRSSIRFGKPVPPPPDPTDGNSRDKVSEWTGELMHTINDLCT